MMGRSRAIALGALVAIALVTPLARAQDACDLEVDCDVQTAQGQEPCAFDLRRAIDRAANAALGAEGPTLPAIRSGCAGGALVAGRVPCQLLRAFAYARSRWRHFCTEGCGVGSRGPTRVSAVCGLGLTGVSTAEASADVDLARCASSAGYNAGAGARRLAEAWGTTPCVGAHDPDVAEHWYFAVWAADELTYANNPNNPAYPVLRSTYGGVSGLDRGSYPFQEVVFGLAGHPPLDDDGAALWEPSPVNLPETSTICGTAACLPANVPAPAEVHDRDCPPFVPPSDGGAGDGGSADAGPDDGGGDAGNIEPRQREPGCGCRLAGSRGRGTGPSGAALLCALVAAIARRRRS